MICIVCRFEIEPDDMELRFDRDRCVCLTCFHRDGVSQKPMPKAMRQELAEVLSGINADWFHGVKPPSSGYYQGGFRPTA